MALTNKDLQAIRSITEEVVDTRIEKAIDDFAVIVARGFTGEREHNDKQFAEIRGDIGGIKQDIGGMKQDIRELKEGQERIERKQNIQQVLLERHDSRITKVEKKVL